jgi:uncharacterized membrane protein
VLLGAAFRFVGLGDKVFWTDETYTALAVASTRMSELSRDVFNGRVLSRDEVLRHQFPRQDRNLLDTIRELAGDQPRHPPLYFVTAHASMRVFGSSIAVLRALSAVLSLASLPLLFLLCRELTGRIEVGWVAVGLAAVSPLHWSLAQFARMYTAWIDLVLVASWLLLRTMRPNEDDTASRIGYFVAYAVTLFLALCTHLLTTLVSMAHALFVLGHERWQATPSVRRTMMTMAGVALGFSPWAYLVVEDYLGGRPWFPWTTVPVPLGEWLSNVIRAVAKTFLDPGGAGIMHAHVLIALIPLAAVVPCALIGIRATSRRARIFLLAVVAACWLPFAAVDLLAGGIRAWIIRYQFPAVIALEIAVALGLVELLMSRQSGRQRAGAALAAFFVVCGIVSRIAYVSRTGEPRDEHISAVAAVVNQSPAPVILTGHSRLSSLGNIFTLAHEVGDHVRLQIVLEPTEPPLIPEDAADMFVWRVTDEMLAQIAGQGWSIDEFEVAGLYRLSRERPFGVCDLPQS